MTPSQLDLMEKLGAKKKRSDIAPRVGGAIAGLASPVVGRKITRPLLYGLYDDAKHPRKFKASVEDIKKSMKVKTPVFIKNFPGGAGPAVLTKEMLPRGKALEKMTPFERSAIRKIKPGAYVGINSLSVASHELGHAQIDEAARRVLGKKYKYLAKASGVGRRSMYLAPIAAAGSMTIDDPEKRKKVGYGASLALSPILASEVGASATGFRHVKKTHGLRRALRGSGKTALALASYLGFIGSPALSAYISTRKNKKVKVPK